MNNKFKRNGAIKFICIFLTLCFLFPMMISGNEISESNNISENALTDVLDFTEYIDLNGQFSLKKGDLTTEQLKTAKLAAKDLPEALGAVDPETTKHVNRLYAQEENDLTTLLFQNRDGTKTMYTYANPVKYIDKSGNIKDKSTALTETEKGYYTADTDVTVTLPKNISEGVSVNYYDFNVSLKPYQNTMNKVVALKNDGKVGYSSVFGSGTSLVYTPLLSGIKEDIILNSYTGQNEFKFILNTNGLSLLSDEFGNFNLFNDEGEKIISIGQVIMYDSDGKTAYGRMTADKVEENEEYIIAVIANIDFLTDEKTVYPVTVDPTFIIEKTMPNIYGTYLEGIEDTTIFSNHNGSTGTASTLFKCNVTATQLDGVTFVHNDIHKSLYVASYEEIKSVMNFYMDSTTGLSAVREAFTSGNNSGINKLLTLINNNMPIMLMSRIGTVIDENGEYSYHMTVIYGYRWTGIEYKFLISEPYSEYYQTCEKTFNEMIGNSSPPVNNPKAFFGNYGSLNIYYYQ